MEVTPAGNPTDDCPHDVLEYDEATNEEYCVKCGTAWKVEPGGWSDPEEADET